MKRRILGVILALAMALSFTAPAFAAPAAKGDVAEPLDGGSSDWAEEFCIEAVGDTEQYVPCGGSLTLQVTVASGDPEGVTYQWYSNESSMTRDVAVDPIPGAESDTYTVQSVTGRVDLCCEAVDRNGAMSNVWFHCGVDNGLTVDPVGDWTRYVESGTCETLQVVVSAYDTDGLHYQWYRRSPDGGSLDYLDGDSDTCTTEGVTEHICYGCEVTDRFGNMRCVEFDLYIINGLNVWPRSDTDLWVSPGGSAVLQVGASASDMEGLSYQWYRTVRRSDEDGNTWMEEEAIPGAESDTYTAENVTGYTEFFCRVTDNVGNSAEVWFYLHIENHLEAWAEDGSEVIVPYGERAVLKTAFRADEEEGVTFQWILCVFNEDLGENEWIPIDGATTDTYVVESVTEARNYYCDVTDRFGNTSEAYFYVHVESDLRLSPVGDTDISVPEGSTATLQVEVSGMDLSQVELQWYGPVWMEDVHGGGYWGMGPIQGANEETFTTREIYEYTEYYCMATDPHGYQPVVWFYVQPVFGGETGSLDAWPVGDSWIRALPGGSATMEVGYICDHEEALTFQWYRRTYDADGEAVDQEIPGAVTASYTASNVTERQEYICMLTCNDSCVAIWFCVEVENHLEAVAAGRESFRVRPGGSATLEVAVSADDMTGITYRWATESMLLAGETGSSLTVENVTERNCYICTVTDRYGNTREVNFWIYVDNGFSASIAGERDKYVPVNESVTLETVVSAYDTAGMTYQWYYRYEVIEGATSSTYTVSRVNQETRGHYSCEVTDRYGNSDIVGCNLYVDNGLSAQAVGGTELTVPYGGGTTLEVAVTAYDKTDLDIRWFRDWQEIDGERGEKLTVSDLTSACEFECEITDRYFNSVTLYFTVGIENGLTAAPVGDAELTVPCGGSVDLAVEASANDMEGLTYQWTYTVRNSAATGDSGELTGQRSPAFSADNITEAISYVCTVTDKYGNQAAVWFNVWIDNDFQVTGGGTVTVAPHGAVTLHVDARARNTEGLTFQWGNTDTWLQNATDTLTLSDVTEGGEYVCFVMDRYHNWKEIPFRVVVSASLAGWQKIDGKWYYYEDGAAVTGWKKISDLWYHFDADGVMQTGWQKINDVWYYFKDSGSMVTGWQKINNVWYYFKDGGAMVTGWQKINNVWYYFKDGGAMVTGWQKINDVWYYFKDGGAMVTGWQKINNVWYYFKDGGAMVTGWQKIGGAWYYFKDGGAMVTGWQKINNVWYYFKDGGAMVTGWLKLGSTWYYFQSGGAMAADTDLTINGKTYHFNASGACTNP